MRLLCRDMTALQVFPPYDKVDRAGVVYNTYPEPDGTFWGNLQPYPPAHTQLSSGNQVPRAYGIRPDAGYLLFTGYNNLRILDRVGVEDPDYEVVAVQKWRGFSRVSLRRIRH